MLKRIGKTFKHALGRQQVARLLKAQRAYASYDVGEWSYGSPKVLFGERGTTLTIGNYCSIAAGTTILLGGDHFHDRLSTYPFAEMLSGAAGAPPSVKSKGGVKIGHDVWIGREVMILSGVTIGSGAVIGARSVVTRDVPPYSIVAGAPARVIRCRFTEDVVASLLRIAWWDWPHDRVLREFIPALCDRPEVFCARYDKAFAGQPIGELG